MKPQPGLEEKKDGSPTILHKRDSKYCSRCANFEVAKQTECLAYVPHKVTVQAAAASVYNPLGRGPAIC